MSSLPYAWLERRLFEVLGGWVPSTPEFEVKLLLRRHSFLHAAHAEVVPGDGAPVGDGLVKLVDAVAAPAGTGERLAGAYGVLLPALADSYRRLGMAGLSAVVAEEESALAEGVARLGRWDTDEEVRRHRSVITALSDDAGL